MKRAILAVAVVAMLGGTAAAATGPGGPEATPEAKSEPVARAIPTPEMLRSAQEARDKARQKKARERGRKRLRRKVLRAGVDPRWNTPLATYTGGSYGIGVINQMWPSGPKRGGRREVMIREAMRYKIPYKVLVGVYGIESGFGRYACSFGLTGFYSSGTSGSFSVDARIAARLLAKLWRGAYGGRAVT